MSVLVTLRARWGTSDVRVVMPPDDVNHLYWLGSPRDRRFGVRRWWIRRPAPWCASNRAEQGGCCIAVHPRSGRATTTTSCVDGGVEVHLGLAASSKDVVFVHAGAVAIGGVGVVIPGRSMTGKTSLVAALVGLGVEYLSDEYAVLDTDGRVHPYVKPLSVRCDAGARRVEAPAIGPIAQEPVRVIAVIDTWFDGPSRWMPRTHSGADVVIPLLDNAVAARLRPDLVLDAAAAVANGGAVRWTGPAG